MAKELSSYLDMQIAAGVLTPSGKDAIMQKANQQVSVGNMSPSQDTILKPDARFAAEQLAHLWEQNIARLIALEFHKAPKVRMSAGKYKDTFPRFLPQREAFRGRFDIPIPVESRIPLSDQHRAAGVTEYIDTGRITNITPISDKPYTIWTHDAQVYRGRSVREVRGQLASDEVASPLVEVTALFIQKPEIFEDHGVDAAGSRYEDVYVPCLRTFNGGPRVNADWDDDADSDWGSLSRGNEINVEV